MQNSVLPRVIATHLYTTVGSTYSVFSTIGLLNGVSSPIPQRADRVFLLSTPTRRDPTPPGHTRNSFPSSPSSPGLPFISIPGSPPADVPPFQYRRLRLVFPHRRPSQPFPSPPPTCSPTNSHIHPRRGGPSSPWPAAPAALADGDLQSERCP
jgi:hypothetical protein